MELDGADDRVKTDIEPCKEIKFELVYFRIIKNDLYPHILYRYVPVNFLLE